MIEMKTEQMKKLVASTGNSLKREEYAGTNHRGQLVSRYRWAIHTDATGVRLCQGKNPKQCFNAWLALGWKPQA